MLLHCCHNEVGSTYLLHRTFFLRCISYSGYLRKVPWSWLRLHSDIIKTWALEGGCNGISLEEDTRDRG